jgi:predicted SAM-dependent methyltransferase
MPAAGKTTNYDKPPRLHVIFMIKDYLKHMLRCDRAFWHARAKELRRLRDAEIIRARCQPNSGEKLHLGAGFHVIPGWINTDLEPSAKGCLVLDAARPLPCADDSLQFVFCEHLIEHMGYAQGVQLIKESFRCLQPGGRLRIATPWLEHYLGLFSASERTAEFLSRYGDLLSDHPMSATKAINHVVRNWGHQFIWSAAELRESLLSQGFTAIATQELGKSAVPELTDLERHQETVDFEVNRQETLIIEAVKPGRA